ncbi:MAG: thymidylate synthase, partial [Patescibacteria group bacterium]
MRQYLEIVRRILDYGERKPNRTGVDTLAIAGAFFEHDMAAGFPLLTTKRMAFRSMATELEGFINGVTDKRWFQERSCSIWDEWGNPTKAPYGHDPASKARMAAERDLGPIYGFQWRHFGARYVSFDTDYTGQGIDQLAALVKKLKIDLGDRRMLVSAWEPAALGQMALPPCHYGFQVTVIGGKLHLMWNQRSVDTMVGLPFNIASYGLLLHLLAKEAGLKEGRLVGFLGDVHIYGDHIEGAREQLSRDPDRYLLPQVLTERFTSIFDWKAGDTRFAGYQSFPKIEFAIHE